jgi:2-iminobutanoate/2-iminopropanoate deaminase
MNPTNGKLVESGVADATKQVMENISSLLKEADMTTGDIVKCSIFLKNMDDFNTVNEIYGQYFRSNPPARETVQVAKLPLDVAVEISCIAIK